MESKPDIWPKSYLEVSVPSAYLNAYRPKLDTQRIPANILPVIHYAEYWGGTMEEPDRMRLIECASTPAVENLVAVVSSFEEYINDWLLGPVIDEKPVSTEYVAFTQLIMAMDYARGILRDRKG